MKLNNEITPTALRSAFVAPTPGGSVAGVCPQTGARHLAAARTRIDFQTDFLGGGANKAMGYRTWSLLIT